MVPFKRVPSLTIAIPASFTSGIPHLREKTLKIGFLARAAAIFRVDEIIIFPDLSSQDQSKNIKIIQTILSYLDTPQYLRKALIPFQKELKYSGILPPLRTPHHPLNKKAKDLRIGDFREGVVVRTNKSNSIVDIGVDKYAVLQGKRLPLNSRLTIKIVGINRKLVKTSLIRKEEINIYWGYDVTVSNLPLGKVITQRRFDLVVMTSKRGNPAIEAIDAIKNTWKKASTVLIAFGSPKEGLIEILKREKIKITDVADLVINTVPQQGTKTVRTEEAVYTTLAIINIIT